MEVLKEFNSTYSEDPRWLSHVVYLIVGTDSLSYQEYIGKKEGFESTIYLFRRVLSSIHVAMTCPFR
jgi:hypothetical protein